MVRSEIVQVAHPPPYVRSISLVRGNGASLPLCVYFTLFFAGALFFFVPFFLWLALIYPPHMGPRLLLTAFPLATQTPPASALEIDLRGMVSRQTELKGPG